MIHAVFATQTGNGTFYLGTEVEGKIHAIKIVAGAVTASWELAVTGETSGVPILTHTDLSASATTWLYPRDIPHKVSDGLVHTNVASPVHVFSERIKCVITNAGTTKDVTITAYYDAPPPY